MWWSSFLRASVGSLDGLELLKNSRPRLGDSCYLSLTAVMLAPSCKFLPALGYAIRASPKLYINCVPSWLSSIPDNHHLASDLLGHWLPLRFFLPPIPLTSNFLLHDIGLASSRDPPPESPLNILGSGLPACCQWIIVDTASQSLTLPDSNRSSSHPETIDLTGDDSEDSGWAANK